MSKFRIYFLTFTLILFSSNSAWATPLLTAQCGVLQGVKLVEGEEKPNISPESHSGNPVLIVDSENPKKLISLWKSKLFDKETVDTYQASIVELSPSRLQAVEHDEYGLYSYTLFLDTGTLFYSHHRLLSVSDKSPSLLSFVGHCKVKVSQ